MRVIRHALFRVDSLMSAVTLVVQQPGRRTPRPPPSLAAQSRRKPSGEARRKDAKTGQATDSAAKAADDWPALQAERSRDSYNAIPVAERMSIQSDLVWTGDYNGLINGEFSDRSIAAVKAFQKRNKTKETGVLNLQERAALTAAAKPKQDEGRLAAARRSGDRRADRPAGKLVPQTSQRPAERAGPRRRDNCRSRRFRSASRTTLDAVFERQQQEPAGRKAEYNVMRDRTSSSSPACRTSRNSTCAAPRAAARCAASPFSTIRRGRHDGPDRGRDVERVPAVPDGPPIAAAAAPQGRICERRRGQHRRPFVTEPQALEGCT